MSYSPIEIEEAKQLAEAHGFHELVIWSFNETAGQHVTTYGFPALHSLAAARAGNAVKKAAGWPEEQAQALPRINRVTLELAAAAIANERAGRRGAPPIANVLEILPETLRREVFEDAEAVLVALGFEREGASA